jgi:quinol monooxygenase YgiN
MAVVVMGSLRFPPENMGEVRSNLSNLVQSTKQNDGCIAYDVAEDLFDLGLVRFSEIWPDAISLDRHLQAPHITPWRNAAKALGVCERNFTAFDAANQRPI